MENFTIKKKRGIKDEKKFDFSNWQLQAKPF